MTVELARTRAVERPWGVSDPGPWTTQHLDDAPVGEVWYERPGETAAKPSLLLKLLLSSQPLSIQVHPDDAYARSKGLANGKSEAWYVLSATPGAGVALGLKQQISSSQLREAAEDGSIAQLVAWKTVVAGDVIYVPAGTIHAIGAGLVIAEIQQRCDATYRLFDHGRQRALHIDDAIAVADAGPAAIQRQPIRLDRERTILVRSPHFVYERLELAPGDAWRLDAQMETWMLAIGGSATAGTFDITIGDAIFMQANQLEICAGMEGLVVLAAYAGGRPMRELIQPSRWKAPVIRVDAKPPRLRECACISGPSRNLHR